MKRLAIALAFGALACAPVQSVEDSGSSVEIANSIRVFTDKSTYRGGETVQLRIVNGREQTYAFNPCTRFLERREGDRWVQEEEQRVCTMIAWLIEPGQTRTATTEIQTGLPPGTYRLSITFSAQTTPSEVIRASTAPITLR